jgi:hypothetical protein
MVPNTPYMAPVEATVLKSENINLFQEAKNITGHPLGGPTRIFGMIIYRGLNSFSGIRI